MSSQPENPIPQVGKLVSVVPVGLKEAALDSPTFRATTLHFVDQIEALEKWLDGYAKAATKLTGELSALENVLGNYLSYSANVPAISEAVIDHDYALLAMRRCGDTSRDVWTTLVSATKKLDVFICEPIRNFINVDLKNFKETRRTLDQAQKQYDYLQARYSSQSKSKEPSSLREDAFQLHEARKAYLKASMDFSVQAPMVRNALDRLLVRISVDQWREFKTFHDSSSVTFAKWGHEMDRVKGWIHEIDASERFSKRELLNARKQIEEAAELVARPSRELDDYSISTVPYLGSRPPPTISMTKEVRPEKQGWLNLRTLSGKPSRTIWVRRWAFLKNGIFGCLVLGSRTGGVEESERIGVLLCSVRPAFQEERRFCFEVKTKSNSIMLQAETQKELMDWIGAFEAAKQKSLENPASTDVSVSGKFRVQDPAFSISQPPAPEFAADPADSLTPHANDEQGSSERNGNLALPDRDAITSRVSTDLSNPRRLTGVDLEHSAREHTARIIQKLDLHRKPTMPAQPSPPPQSPSGGLATLISASHHILPCPAVPVSGFDEWNRGRMNNRDVPATSLAPSTLANPPAPTSMSKAAVFVINERGIGLGQADSTGGMPSGMMANLWGSSNWGFVNRLERDDSLPLATSSEMASSPVNRSRSPSTDSSSTHRQLIGSRHRQTLSLGGDANKIQWTSMGASHEYPSYYPQQLRTQDAQFRLLFPDVKREEPLIMVFRATWSPNDQQEFPGRTYITTRNLHFYSNYLGLVLTSIVPLHCVTDVTAAPGRDCDFLFLHTLPPRGSDTPGRVTLKTFLEPLRLLQKRLRLMVRESAALEPLPLETLFKTLIRMESDAPTRTPSSGSWEDLSLQTPADEGFDNGNPNQKSEKDVRASIYIEKDLDITKTGRRDVPKFRLPTQPVQFIPQGNLYLAAEKVLDISPKALFHVLFGDKSAVWQLLLYERRAREIKQGPWASTESRLLRRDFQYLIETTDLLGRSQANTISDYQIIDVLNDHLCYVVTDKRSPWHLPFRRSFMLVSKIVITFVSKSRSKLAIYTKVEWLRSPPRILTSIIDGQAMSDLEQDALDLLDLVSDQVRRLGAHSRTKKAISIFGHVGRQNRVSEFSGVGMNVKFEPRKPRIQRTLPQLLFETIISFLESAISSVMIWAFAIVRWIWKTTSANKVILMLLLSSVVFNAFYSSRDAYDWWQERNAVNFMARLGIRADNVMGKAIYIRDIDEAVANSTVWQTNSDNNSSDCFSTFHEQAIQQENGLAFSLTASGPRNTLVKTSLQRFQQTRERLGMRRHDLIVALRVINSIEGELVQNEWERWLRQELRRCQQVEALLNASDNDDEGDNVVEGRQLSQNIFAEHTDDVRLWYNRYCTSCQREQEEIERSHVSHVAQPAAMYRE